ncbi:MAG TPA: PAS domain S-box protein [Myxococcales bacterium]|jgi:PAS domain S-box-containing protein
MADGADSKNASPTDARPRFRAVVEASPFGMHLYRLEPDGRLVFSGANPAADRILGVANQQFVGKTLEEAFPPLAATEVPERYRAAARDGTSWRTEQVSYQDGRICGAYDVTAFQIAPGEMAALFQDITERKRAEVALAQEKERLSVTLRSIGDAVVSTDVSGRVTLMNRVAERLTGFKAAEALGRPIGEVFRIVDPATRSRCEDPVQKVLSTGGVVELAGRTLLLSRDGTERMIGDSGAPIRDDRSQVVGVVLVFRDTTERERLEEAERRAQRLESLGLLAGGIAHDFNNLLSGLFSYVDLAREACHEPEAVREYMTSAASVLGRAKGLTAQLRSFAKGSSPVRRTVDLGSLLRETTHFALTGSAVSPAFEISPDLDCVYADPGQLGQVLENLLINAKQAMPSGGRVTVRAVNLEPGAALPDQLPRGRYVKVAIQDTGVGISAENLAKVFDPFFTTKQNGSGLGLTMAHSIVRKHDGAMAAESEPGQGSTFWVWLPSQGASEVAAEPARKRRRFEGLRALVLDDESYVRDVAAAMLRRMGCEVSVAREGAEAVEMARKALAEGRRFDVFLLDLTIPGGLGGKQVVEALRPQDPGLVAVASSGYSEDPIIASPKEHGFSGAIRKPYVMDELAAAVEEAMKAAKARG